jgi:hypothetical protein
MGLDITAYRKLKEVRPRPDTNDESGYTEGLISLFDNPDFPGRIKGVKAGTWYRPSGKAFGFRAGSYSGYNAWRDWLARLAGYDSARACYRYNKTGPFVELINFSDCEGTIGPVVAAKLVIDFGEYDERAQACKDSYNYERFGDWRKAFQMAADGGAVQFH